MGLQRTTGPSTTCRHLGGDDSGQWAPTACQARTKHRTRESERSIALLPGSDKGAPHTLHIPPEGLKAISAHL